MKFDKIIKAYLSIILEQNEEIAAADDSIEADEPAHVKLLKKLKAARPDLTKASRPASMAWSSWPWRQR